MQDPEPDKTPVSKDEPTLIRPDGETDQDNPPKKGSDPVPSGSTVSPVEPTLAPPRPDDVTLQPPSRPTTPERPRAPEKPEQIVAFGDYEILGTIARGGMGIVYKARQKKLNRIVAIKMILSGQFADQSAIDRFYAEAEAAANLRHPHIVAIHEIGEHAGQHFFSMDFIDGKSLAELVRDRPLAPEQAAELVQCISDTIQYAHDRGILHRDLKPSNILVDKHQAPLVTDFGLAKQVSSESQITMTGAIVGTPSYMPPEQAAGRHEQVGTCSDIYSLGAILYELVTGSPPFRAASPFETIRQVLQNEPASPRLLNPSVPRDLETICLKCLQKEPGQRYARASDLAEELARFRRGEPIQARPLGRLARGWRWCRRNPLPATTIGAAVVFLLVALVATTAGYIYTSRALTASEKSQRESEASFRQALQVVNVFFTRVSEDTLLNQPGMQPLRRDLLVLALDYYQRLLAQRKNDPTLADELAATYFRIGVITELLESPAKGVPYYEDALMIQRRLLVGSQGQVEQERLAALSATLNALGTAYFKLLQFDKARESYDEAVALRTRLANLATDNNGEYRRVLANTHMNLGLVQSELGQPDKAREAYRTAQSIRQHALQQHPGDPKLLRDSAKGHFNLGSLLIQEGGLTEASESFRAAAEQFEELLAQSAEDLEYQKLLAYCYRLLGDLALEQQAESEIGRIWYLKAIRRMSDLSQANPHVTEYQLEHADLLRNTGLMEAEAGHGDKARQLLQQSVEILRPITREHAQTPQYRRSLSIALTCLGEQQLEDGDPRGAKSSFVEARDLLDQLVAEDAPNTRELLEDVRALLELVPQDADTPAPP